MVASFFALVKALDGTRHVVEYSLKLDSTLNSLALHLLLMHVVSTALLNTAAQVATQYSTFHQLGFLLILLKNYELTLYNKAPNNKTAFRTDMYPLYWTTSKWGTYQTQRAVFVL